MRNMDYSDWKRVEKHFARKCELNERGEILYEGTDYVVGYYITEGEWKNWVSDATGDRDRLVFKTKG